MSQPISVQDIRLGESIIYNLSLNLLKNQMLVFLLCAKIVFFPQFDNLL